MKRPVKQLKVNTEDVTLSAKLFFFTTETQNKNAYKSLQQLGPTPIPLYIKCYTGVTFLRRILLKLTTKSRKNYNPENLLIL